ncbi:hypothetical protein CYMTET_22701 [Cymbomonas tetramitiformis]|uniref:Uncharacterized protein n=1 Tax=Cymbomonas tetramitiformis TaxID=36881 RepID=A0AAE0FZE3_9CHLO|nr:hypothetical protein CYMTET_22701 [Cymbomonas tetramitiformis]
MDKNMQVKLVGAKPGEGSGRKSSTKVKELRSHERKELRRMRGADWFKARRAVKDAVPHGKHLFKAKGAEGSYGRMGSADWFKARRKSEGEGAAAAWEALIGSKQCEGERAAAAWEVPIGSKQCEGEGAAAA